MSSGVFLRCNSCWCDLEGKAVATACQHIFCLKCAQQIVENNSGCTVCSAAITKSTMKMVASLQDAAAVKMLLCGQVPEAAFASALASVQFYIAQQQMQADLRAAQLDKKVNKVQEACRKRLEQVHNAYTQAKRKYEEAVSSKEQAQQDAQELQAKYAQKSMQTRKLQEMLKKTQQQLEAAQQEAKAAQQEKGVMVMELTAAQQEIKTLRQSNGGLGAGRSISPLAPGDMVTTLQRTTQQIFTTSPPNMGGYRKSIQQSLAPSSGRVQGITGGYRTQQGVHTSGGIGSAGRILGGSLDPNSPGGVLPSASQGLGRTGSDGSFGVGLGGGPRHGGVGGGVAMSAQDPNNNALRKMLGMPLTQSGGRNAGLLGDSLFSM